MADQDDAGGGSPKGKKPRKWISDETGAPRSGHTRRMREDLRRAREERDWSTREVAEKLVAVGAVHSLTGEAVRKWETLEANPAIEAFSEWAKVLDYQLIVDMVPRGDKWISVPVRTDLVALVRLLGSRVQNADDVALVQRVARLLADLPGTTDEGERTRRFLEDDVSRGERDVAIKKDPAGKAGS
jgi:transcriptional regulator with XRE-family HTH domain